MGDLAAVNGFVWEHFSMGKKRVSRSEYDRRLARRRATGRPRQTRAVRHDIQSSALTVAQLASDVREEIDILKAEISAGQRTLEEKERFLANLLSAAGIQRASENGMRAHRTIRYDEVIPWLHATLRAEGNRAFAVEIYRRADGANGLCGRPRCSRESDI